MVRNGINSAQCDGQEDGSGQRAQEEQRAGGFLLPANIAGLAYRIDDAAKVSGSSRSTIRDLIAER